MKRTMLSGLTAVALLAVLANAPAHAQQFRHNGVFKAITGHGVAHSMPQNSLRWGRGEQRLYGIDPATLLALSILRRKCLDNILPECPKPE